MSDVVERLRFQKMDNPYASEYGKPAQISVPLCVEAADTITALRAENEKLNAEVERWVKAHGIAFDQAMENGSAVTALRAEVAQLQKALEHIVERSLNDPIGTSKVIDMRKIARAALSSITGDE